MMKDKRSDLFSLIQISPVSSLPITHRITIQTPCLPTRPSRLMSISLMGMFVSDITCYRIVINHMIRTIIFPEMILHRIIGVSHRNLVECGITRCFGCPKQKFKVHHIIYDNRILPFVSIMIPRTNTTDHRIKTRGQRIRPLQQNLFIFIRLPPYGIRCHNYNRA